MPKTLVPHFWMKLFKYSTTSPFTTKLYLIVGISKWKRQQEFKTKSPFVSHCCWAFFKTVLPPRSNCIFIAHTNFKNSYDTEIAQVYFLPPLTLGLPSSVLNDYIRCQIWLLGVPPRLFALLGSEKTALGTTKRTLMKCTDKD